MSEPSRAEPAAAPVGDVRPTLLVACTQHWDSPYQVGSHHLARAFADAGWRVGFLGAPVHALHLAGRGRDTAARVAAMRRGGVVDPATGIWHAVPFAPLPWGAAPLIRSRAAVRLGWAACRPALARMLAGAGFTRPDLGIADHFLHEGLLRAAAPRRTVYRRADDPSTMPGAGADFARRDLAFARRADLTLCPTATAAEAMRAAGAARARAMPNGVDLGRFLAPAPPPPEYAGDARPVVVYVGADDHRFDAGLVAEAARTTPQAHWVAIGEFGEASATRLRAAGVDVLGPRPHAGLAGYLQHARVGVVPFAIGRDVAATRDVSPLKVLEYAACGLPVVASAGWHTPGGLPVPLRTVTHAGDFGAAVAQALAAPPPPRPGADALAAFGWPARLAPLFAWASQPPGADLPAEVLP